MGRSYGKSGPGGSPPPLPDRAEGTIDPDQVDPRGASRQYAGTNQGCSMSIETTRPAPAGAPGALPSAESAATYNDTVVHQVTVATVYWGIVGMGVGVFIDAQLEIGRAHVGTPVTNAHTVFRHLLERTNTT